MQVVINGRNTSIDKDMTVAEFVESLALRGKIAVEINREIIPRSRFGVQTIREGDVIEIVQAIGGGCSS